VSTAIFEVGQRVRIGDREPGVHHRVPAYAKGKVGVVQRVCGIHPMPEKSVRGDGEPLQRIYRVRLSMPDTWEGYQGGGRDELDIEIFEHWLEAAD